MQNNVAEYKSVKSNSTYTVTTENGMAYLGVTGEASTNPKVIAEKERIRKSGGKYRIQTLRSCQMKAEREARYA